MSEHTWYYHRENGQTVRSRSLGQVFSDWRGVVRDHSVSDAAANERWLVLAPHDDDLVIGAGLAILSAVAAGVEVYVAVTSDGRMGYCDPEQRSEISSIRYRETVESLRLCGVPESHLTWLAYPDSSLSRYLGHRFETPDGFPPPGVTDPAVIVATATGLQHSYTKLLRDRRPNRLLIPTLTDLHPDHQDTHREMMISVFHAQGDIWPELGEPLESVPRVYEYACYCDFVSPPDLQILATPELFQRKLDAIAEYRSQKQITLIVEGLRATGPVEYLREYPFHYYEPARYRQLFDDAVEV